MKRRFIGLLSAAVLALTSVPAMTASAADQTDTGVTSDGYNYELWNQDYQGTANWNVGQNGTYSCSWSGIKNVLFRTGKKFSDSPMWSSLNGIKIDYEASEYSPNGNSYLCVYGWTRNPLVEYYIVETYGNWRPPGTGPNMSKVGEITVNDGTYEVYKGTHDGPSIDPGVTHFNQYWSVRKDGQLRTKGTIDVDQHFKAWEEQFGMTMGGLYEVALNVEGYMSSGRATISKNDLTLGGGVNPTTSEPIQVIVPEDGYYFNCDFEDGEQGWKSRGDASVSLDKENYYEGKQSLKVTGRTDYWHGASIALDSSQFIPGTAYSFDAAVLQNSGSATAMKMTLQYTDASGTDHYDEVGSVTAKSGEWTAIGNTGYTIPTGASKMLLYIEAPESKTDFYIDKASGAVKGKASQVTTGGGTVTTTPITTTVTDGPINVGDAGLKDIFAKYFRFGTCVSPDELSSGKDFLVKNFNSITPENELKPDAVLDKDASRATGEVQVTLAKAAKTLKFCEDNNIPLRGHTFVWYSQTPEWFFRQNFDDNGAYVSKDEMNKRLETFIKKTFEAIKTQYPKLNLYSYDVANELFINNGGSMRPASGEDNSAWARVYGNNNDEFVINAFTYARQYAPEGCKLYINDYNEYISDKTNDIYNLAMKLKEKGLIDGIGMQSHLATGYPSASVYKTGLEKFLSTGLEVQITELDITCGGDLTAQAALYKEIVKLAMAHADQIPTLTVWGTMDHLSWRKEGSPLLFTNNYTTKPAYESIVALVDPADIGVTTGSSTGTTTVTTTTETTTTTTKTTEPKAVKAGDVDENGRIDVADAVLLARAIGNDPTVSKDISTQGLLNAECDGKSGLSDGDLTALLMYLASLRKTLG